MKLHYIYHSGFALETDELILLFDYFKDSNEEQAQAGIVHEQLLTSQKKMYVLATHAHADHFNPTILAWRATRPNIQYVFSQDILDLKLCKEEDAFFMEKGDTYEDDCLRIEAFGSTDAGISFLVQLNNKLIFHAGDLNNWHWKDEADQQFIQEAESWYLRELNDIYRKYKVIDLVLFPVDQRMKTDYYLGAEQFIKRIDTAYFAPMHFDEDYAGAQAFEAVAQENNTHFLKITQRGQSFDLDL